MEKSRTVRRVLPSVETLEGAGFLVHRPFPTSALDHFDPFLLLDEMGPMDLGPGQARGAPDHPHRGFETVTYLLSGQMEHGDSRGNRGRLGPGDVQWMTAGSGVVHSERPGVDFAARGGRMHGFQLWVNLPRRDKMMAPRYQEVPAAKIPVARSADGTATVRVIAGESLGAHAVIDTRTPISYFDVELRPGGVLEQPLEADHNAFVYVFEAGERRVGVEAERSEGATPRKGIEGSGLFGAERTPARPHELVLFRNDGAIARLEAPADSPLRALLVAGRPLDEPVARAGPFVMNTRAEVVQAFEDFQTGRLG
jgi:redox-sensitive bicupin YhaK (pirin superfamily)